MYEKKLNNDLISTSHVIQDGRQRLTYRVFSKHDFKTILCIHMCCQYAIISCELKEIISLKFHKYGFLFTNVTKTCSRH